MFEKGSLVKYVDMEYEEGTGFHKKWMNGIVGTITRIEHVTNIHTGISHDICIVEFLTPVINLAGARIPCNGGTYTENLEEIFRVPIVTRTPITE